MIKECEQKIGRVGARFIELRSISSDDDGWYQCHVGVYVSKRIVEKIGFVYLNVLGGLPTDIVKMSVVFKQWFIIMQKK